MIVSRAGSVIILSKLSYNGIEQSGSMKGAMRSLSDYSLRDVECLKIGEISFLRSVKEFKTDVFGEMYYDAEGYTLSVIRERLLSIAKLIEKQENVLFIDGVGLVHTTDRRGRR